MKKNWVSLLLVVLSFIVSVVFYGSLPEEMVIHWNAAGEPDGFASKLWAVSFGPLTMILLFVLLTVVPKIDPKKENYSKFKHTYSLIVNAIMMFMLLIHISSIGYGLGYDIKINFIVPLFVGVLFIVLGNYMPKIKPNYFAGIRTPWTLDSEDVWKRTHRFSGKVFVGMGILMLLSAFLPATFKFTTFMVVVVLGVLLTTISSYYFSKKFNK